MIGKKDKDIVAGAVVGAGIGYLVANDVAKRKAKYAREEDFLDSEIVLAKQYNAEAGKYNVTLKQQIATLDKRANTLVAEYKAGKADQSSLVALSGDIKAKIRKNQTIQKDLEHEHAIKVAVYKEQKHKNKQNDPQVAALNKEIAQLEKNIKQLDQGSKQLAQIDDRLSI